MKYLKILLLIITTNLTPQQHTIFLYGPINGKYIKKEIEFLYGEIAKTILKKNNKIDFWPKRKKGRIRKNVSRFCKQKELKKIYKSIITNIQYKQLKKYIIQQEEPVNIIAIGDGIRVLKNLLQIFAEQEFNAIDKIIIIENPELLKIRQTNGDIFAREIINLNIDPINNYLPYNLNLNDKIVLINAEEYLFLIEEGKEETCCTKYFPKERRKALLQIAVAVTSIIAAII